VPLVADSLSELLGAAAAFTNSRLSETSLFHRRRTDPYLMRDRGRKSGIETLPAPGEGRF
jgi:hypothetical protein